MKPIRFYIAMISARFSYFALKMVGRNATHLPGVIAVTIYPEVLKHLEISENFIAVTGTNGKTSTTNMIVAFLEDQGVDLVANLIGSNIEGGIISALLTSTTFFGKNKKEMAVLEIDERASLRIFPYIQPKILAVTNLFRDSYSRNAHIDYIVETLETSIPKTSNLILNGDDILTSQLSIENKRKYFSIAPLKGEIEVKDSIIQDTPYCPKCHHPLTYDFQRHHHIGKVHCEKCGFSNEEADFQIIEVDKNIIKLKEKDNIYEYKNTTENLTDNYNKLAAISVLRAIGYQHKTIQAYFNNLKTVESRFDEMIVDGKRYVTILAKDQNPVANSRVFDFIKGQTAWGKTTIVIMNEAHGYTKTVNFAENTAWLYDTNFEYLNKSHIQKIYCVGSRAYEYESRLVLAGIAESKIVATKIKPEIKEDFDTIIVLHSTKNIDDAFSYRDKLISKGANHES